MWGIDSCDVPGRITAYFYSIVSVIMLGRNGGWDIQALNELKQEKPTIY